MPIVHRDDLHRGGFAGLQETRMVMDPVAWGDHVEPVAQPGQRLRVYGGNQGQAQTFAAHTVMEVVRLNAEQELEQSTPVAGIPGGGRMPAGTGLPAGVS